MVADAAGNRYVTINGGSDQSVDLDPGPAVQAVTLDATLVKLNPSGALVWNASLNATGGASPVVRILHAVDADQNVYMVGDFRGTVDFDPGPGVLSRTSSQAGAAFSVYLSKLNSAGELQWVQTIGGNGLRPDRLVLDEDGNLVIAANLVTATPIDVDPGPGEVFVEQIGATDLLALKYSPDGEFIWTRQIGGVGGTPSLAVDGQGDVYVGGGFQGSVDLDPGAGVNVVSNPDAAIDGYIVRLTSGGDFVWAYATEGAGSASFRDIEIAGDGSIVVGGYLKGTVDFSPGSGSLPLTSFHDKVDGLVLKLQGDSSVAWVRQFGGDGETPVTEAAVDQEGNIYLGGSFGRLGQVGQTADFDPGPGVYQLPKPSTFETAYVLSLSEAGDFRWAVPLAGNEGRSQVQGMRVSSNGDVHLSGAFTSNGDFDPNPGAQAWLNSGASSSVFVATLEQVAPTPGAPTVDAGPNQTVAVNGSAFLDGTVADDGLPNAVTITWSVASGPGAVTFGDSSALDTTATFSTSGTYLLQLEATDSQFTTTDYVQIVVNPLNAALIATADTYIDVGKATTNFGASASLIVDGKPDDGALLKWDLSSIPAGSPLHSATLSINVTGASADTYEIYQVQRSWTELQATWRKANSATNWQSAGAQGSLDRGSTVLGTVTASTTGIRNVVLNAAGLAVVQGWVNNPSTNFGFIIQDYANTADDDLVFSSKNATVAASRPQLQVTYNPPSPPSALRSAMSATASQSIAGAAFASNFGQTSAGGSNLSTTKLLQSDSPATTTAASKSAVKPSTAEGLRLPAAQAMRRASSALHSESDDGMCGLERRLAAIDLAMSRFGAASE